MYIYFLWLGLTLFNAMSHEMRSTSKFWWERFIMIALKCDMILFESQI